MQIVHKLSLDLMEKGKPARIEVKQGDTLSRSLEITLFSGGEAWLIPANVMPMMRWFASDPDTGESASGIYDTLPNGANAFHYSHNQMDLILVPQMFQLPGLVQCDLVLVQGEKTLATFNFEFYVNRAPVDGTEAGMQDWYKLASLEQINSAITALQGSQETVASAVANQSQEIMALKEWQAGADRLMAELEHEVYALKRTVSAL